MALPTKAQITGMDYVDWSLPSFYVDVDSSGGGGILTTDLVLNLDASDSSSYVGSGTTWTDLSSSSNDGTLVNGVTPTGGDGISLVFDGSNDYVTMSSAMFNPNSDFTISSWVNLDTINNNTIVSTRADPGSFQLRYKSGVGVQIVDSYVVNVGAFSSSETLSTGTWYNITVTRSGNTYTYYLNGSSVSSFTSTNTYDRGPHTIGVNYTGVEQFDGKIGQIFAYSSALSASDVLSNFNATKDTFGLGVNNNAYVNVSGTWKQSDDIYVNVSGTWKNVTNDLVYANINGSWKSLTSGGGGGSSLDSTTLDYVDWSLPTVGKG
mgnify:CR=1 FL=1